MKRTTRSEIKHGYMNYVIEYLDQNPDILKRQRIPSYHFLITSPSNFKRFLRYKDNSTHKSLFQAFTGITSDPDPKTLLAIQNSFEIPIDYEAFSEEIRTNNRAFTKYLNPNYNPVLHLNTPIKIFTVLTKDVTPSKNANKFYNGYAPSWEDLSATFDFQRTCYTQKGGIKETAFKLIQNLYKLHFYFISGAAGTGKTTTLKRLAFDLSKSFSNVYYYERMEKLESTSYDIYSEMCTLITRNAHKKVIFILNECFNLIKPINYLQLHQINEQYSNNQILFIIGDNLTNYNNLLSEYNFITEDIRTFKKLSILDNTEIESILNKIDQLEAEGKLSKINRALKNSELKKLCATKFGNHLLIVFLQLRKGKRFTEIIKDECRNLEKIDPTNFTIKAYSLVCLFRTLKLEIPANILFKSLNQDQWNGFNIIARNCPEILIVRDGRLIPRHSIIAHEVVDLYFKDKEQLLLECLLSIFNIDNLVEDKKHEQFSFEFFSLEKLHLQLLNIFNRNEELIRKLYLNFSQYNKYNDDFFVAYTTSYGWFEKCIFNSRKAATLFYNVMRRRESAFILRMLAYCYLDLKDWKQSAEYAVKAFNSARNEEAKLHAAVILSYNQYAYFVTAGYMFSLLNRSKANKIKRESSKYLNCLKDLSRLKFADQHAITDYMIQRLRPKLIHLNRLTNKESKVNNTELYKILIRQQDNMDFDYDELNSLRNSFDNHGDIKIKSFFYRILAVSLMNKMKTMEYFIRLQEVEDLFNQSLDYNPDDSSTYYYFAIFMKEYKEEFDSAEELFRSALRVGDKSKQPFFRRYPKYLNELAVLLIEESKINSNDDGKRMESFRLLEEAVKEVERRKMPYPNPKNNLFKYSKLFEKHCPPHK